MTGHTDIVLVSDLTTDSQVSINVIKGTVRVHLHRPIFTNYALHTDVLKAFVCVGCLSIEVNLQASECVRFEY